MAEGSELARRSKRRIAEFLTVFLGVALAFLAENWREDLGDRRAETVALAGLLSDFTANAAAREERFEDQQRTRAAIQYLGDLLDSVADGQLVNIPDTLLMAMRYAGTYDPARGSVDALLSSGQIGLIRNTDLRLALASWPSQLGDAVEKQEWQIEFVNNTTRPFLLSERVPLQRIASQMTPWVNSTLPEEARSWVTPMRNSIEFRNVVALRLHYAGLTTDFLSRFMESEDRLLNLIRAEE